MVITKDKIIPTGYKKSEIGLIPKDWDVKRIGDFTDSSAGGTPSTLISEYWGGPIRWMNSGELNNKKIYEVEGRITDIGLKNSSTKIIPANSVLIGLAGQGKTRGTVAINRVELCTNQSIAAIFPSDSFVPDYLYFNLDSRYEELRGLSTGGEGRGGLNLSIIRKLFIPFPEKTEQSVIAEALSDVDDLIALLHLAIAKKRNIKTATMQALLTGKKRLPGFNKKWKINKLSDLAYFLKGRGLSKGKIVNNGKYQCILYGELFTTYSQVINKIKSKTNFNEGLPSVKGDILMPGSTTTVGIDLATASTLQLENVLLGGDVIVIRKKEPNLYNSEFLANYLTHVSKYKIAEITQGITIIHLHGGRLKEIPVNMPSDVNEQNAIANILADLDIEINFLESRLLKTEQIKQGMMQQLLSGRIRLI